MPSEDAGVHSSDDTVTAAVPVITGAVAPKLAPSMRTVSFHSALGASVAAWTICTLVTDGGENAIGYRGLFRGEDYEPRPAPNPPGGFGANIRMSSYVVYTR